MHAEGESRKAQGARLVLTSACVGVDYRIFHVQSRVGSEVEGEGGTTYSSFLHRLIVWSVFRGFVVDVEFPWYPVRVNYSRCRNTLQ